MKKFPKEIYVQRDRDGKDEWFLLEEKLDDIVEDDEDDEVAIYVLKEIKKFKVKRELV